MDNVEATIKNDEIRTNAEYRVDVHLDTIISRDAALILRALIEDALDDNLDDDDYRDLNYVASVITVKAGVLTE